MTRRQRQAHRRRSPRRLPRAGESLAMQNQVIQGKAQAVLYVGDVDGTTAIVLPPRTADRLAWSLLAGVLRNRAVNAWRRITRA